MGMWSGGGGDTGKDDTRPPNELEALRRCRVLLREVKAVEWQMSRPIIGVRRDGSVLREGVWDETP